MTSRLSVVQSKKKKKKKYRGIFETQTSGNKTNSGEMGLNIRTLASPKVEQDQVSGGVSVICSHAALRIHFQSKMGLFGNRM